MKVLLFTYIPSPYQVELFNAIATHATHLHLQVAYLYAQCTAPTAQFWQANGLTHDHWILQDNPDAYAEMEERMNQADLVVFSYYQHPLLKRLIERRDDRQQPWCFWGERPGYRQLGTLGKWYRAWKFDRLHRSKVPIWGMGEWAVDQYRRELGGDRLYINLPYFSDLDRFQSGSTLQTSTLKPKGAGRHFLFSGALIPRKGVDLLATAFDRLAQQYADVRLTFVGEGELQPQLQQRLARWGDRVQFRGFQPWDVLPSLYQTADILCVPSRYDGWALVVPEGLAAGLPVISTTRTGAALELIQPDYNGWLIPPGDSKVLYQVMHQAVQFSPSELAYRSHQAQTSIIQHSLLQGVNRFCEAVHVTLQALSHGIYSESSPHLSSSIETPVTNLSLPSISPPSSSIL